MIHYKEFTLENGLRCLVHEDPTTPLAVLNVLYNVGSRDEDEQHTGFAHLFEHLMFSGSVNIPNYDAPLQQAGGENNAFTSPDLTNYYLTVPAQNIETGFWLESDRMLDLAFSENGLEVQRKVVVEEFKQNYLNQPYGDVWLKLRPLAYHVHPYKWATIGKEVSHIENAVMDDVRAFFKKHYSPANAILVIAGNITFERAQELTQKWFGPIPGGVKYERNLPAEPRQTQARFQEVEAPVPLSALYKAYHMPGRTSPEYYAGDLLADVLGRGDSSRLHHELVKEQKLFNSISAFATGSMEPGLLVIQGKLNTGVDIQVANAAVEAIVEKIRAEHISEEELQKVKNQAETSIVFSEIELLNRAMNLAFGKLMGNPNHVNEEGALVQAVTSEDIYRQAQEILRPDNCSTLFYKAAPGNEAQEELEEVLEEE
ncbi:insulinase family protein [Rufibacter immobilis]|uniref:Insulinase family protein n=1 Tax=Rufibacter immobilis TaxID=1348778 RepID=A0A3M9N413_9BACT|nr:pitrilysin family protein [Rufibacter immobilis]RNI32551.1 insulinase family protein [Rufibacter immobilis]